MAAIQDSCEPGFKIPRLPWGCRGWIRAAGDRADGRPVKLGGQAPTQAGICHKDRADIAAALGLDVH